MRLTGSAFNRVEIDLAALAANYRTLRRLAGPGVELAAVVKADAYGHGMVQVARALAAEGASTFAVAEIAEGAALRRAGVEGEIIVLLGGLPREYPQLLEHRLTTVLFDQQTALELSSLADANGRRLPVHLKVDTGMGRFGLLPEEVPAFVRLLNSLGGLRLTGVLSHLPMADSPNGGPTGEQVGRFRKIIAELDGQLAPDTVRHIGNSAALLGHPGARFDLIRPGIALYGCSPSGDEAELRRLGLQPVMGFKTRVLQVKTLPAGFGIGYGHTYVTERPTRLAVLPVGYADGYGRKLSNRAFVLIRGQRAPVRGRVCMNATMVDITDLEGGDGIVAGEEVVLLGRQQSAEIGAEEMAAWLETISYEVCCLFGALNPRSYADGG